MKARILAIGIVAAWLVSFPAFAVMQPVGSVDLWPAPTRAAAMYPTALTGDLLALTARGNADVSCRTVTATFGDGSSAEIFHGTLAPDDQFKFYLPGGARNIQRMDFDCLSVDRGRAIVDVAANLTPVFVPPG
jgi:hypothetical protein